MSQSEKGEAKGMVKTHGIKGFRDKINAFMHWANLHCKSLWYNVGFCGRGLSKVKFLKKIFEVYKGATTSR